MSLSRTIIPNPIDENRRVGTVTNSTADRLVVNLPNAIMPSLQHGEIMQRGEVGEYICFPRNDDIVLGRITRVYLPERERLALEPRIGSPAAVEPLGEVALLTDVLLTTQDVTGAVSAPPKLGAPAYSVSSKFLQWVLESSARKKDEKTSVSLCIGDVAGSTQTPVLVSPERLFGRHCAILGVTGGGKSWTIARLLEECARYNCKVILIDATGEFSTLNTSVSHYSMGSEKDGPTSAEEVSCPYHMLEEQDLFALFTPSPQIQAPMLREAIQSLKLAECSGLPKGMVNDGFIEKQNRDKRDFVTQVKNNQAAIEATTGKFNVEKLTGQIQRECVYPTKKEDDNKWGGLDMKTIGYCMSLILRIGSMVNADTLKPIFKPGALPSIQAKLSEFIQSRQKRIMRISLRYLPFAQSVRPIVVNAIGRHLLLEARKGIFKDQPVVIILDEAHQFLNKKAGDESNSFALDAFDLIAKEGRKYGLTLCLATQRPRDIQDGVLSQMGTMLVHRLTHGADREVVERAARDVEKAVATFLPTLSPGQALLLGADFPVPIPIQMREPQCRPESKGPNYQKSWALTVPATV